jgi:hypothetical protein
MTKINLLVSQMSDYPPGSTEDRKILAEIPIEELLDFLFLQLRNLWRVDGLYFLGIEEKFGTKTATEIDSQVWKVMAKIEAKSLKRMFKVGENADVPSIMKLLQKSSWALDQPFKVIEVDEKRAVLSVEKCRTQEARLKKGFGEFPCKTVRSGYLLNFAKIFNSNAEVNCLVCPPDEHPSDLWCKWEFILS